MDVLLAASLVSFAVGTGLIITGRWRAVSRLEAGTYTARPQQMLTTWIGLAATVAAALLLIAFIAISMTMSNAAAA